MPNSNVDFARRLNMSMEYWGIIDKQCFLLREEPKSLESFTCIN